MLFAIAGLVILFFLLLLILTRTESGSRALTLPAAHPELLILDDELWLPADRYYGWMINDRALASTPLTLGSLPLPPFRTLPEGNLQVVERYSYDLATPLTERIPSELRSGRVALTPLLNSALKEIKEGEDPEIHRMTKVSDHLVRLSLLFSTGLHDFDLAFRVLPREASLDATRKATTNIGLFSSQIVTNGQEVDIIHRYTTPIEWQVTPEIPKTWYPALQRAVDYWRRRGVKLSLNLSPWTGELSDPRVNLITRSASDDYIGIGTTVVDPRTGQHQWSRIAVNEAPVQETSSLFPNGAASPEDILTYALTHEMGHTLGLRHNFIAGIDRNSSIMAYFPSWYPNAEGVLELMNLEITGTYDELVIAYAYTPRFPDENLSAVPPALQQRIKTAKLHFHTDENIEGDRILARVHRHIQGSGLEGPERWLKAWQYYEPLLFRDPSQRLLDVHRTLFLLTSTTEAVTNAMSFVQGVDTDYRRSKLSNYDRTERVLTTARQFLTGEMWSLKRIKPYLLSVTTADDHSLAIKERPYRGTYDLGVLPLEQLHLHAVRQVAEALFHPARVKEPASVLQRFLGGSKNTNLIVGTLSVIEEYKTRYPLAQQLRLDSILSSFAYTRGLKPTVSTLRMRRHCGN